MKSILLLVLLISANAFNLRRTKQSYDSYVMAVQWSNGYCLANSCGKKADHVNKNGMTIHGLWPSLKSGKMLNPCTTGVTITDDGSELFTKMRQYWPSFAKSNEEFWEHEYNKHGYCMVEEYGWDDYEEYFNFVIDLHLKTYEKLIINAFPNSSDTTTTIESVSFDIPIAALCLVPSSLAISLSSVSGNIHAAAAILLLLITTAPSCNGVFGTNKFTNSCGETSAFISTPVSIISPIFISLSITIKPPVLVLDSSFTAITILYISSLFFTIMSLSIPKSLVNLFVPSCSSPLLSSG